MMIENSMCNDITTEQFDIDQQLYTEKQPIMWVSSKEVFNVKEYKSTLIIGNIHINNIKYFNWLQKKLWKLMFGIEIIDLEKSDSSGNN